MNETHKSYQHPVVTQIHPHSGHVRPHNVPAQPLLHHEKPCITLPGWPIAPKAVKTPIYLKFLNGVFDVLLLACSTAFLAFALIVHIHDQEPTEENSHLTMALLQATKYGPTIFPVLFASVVGRAAHGVLLWRLEKGERIGILDTLASSTSLTSTVTAQLQLRAFSILGLALIVVWSLSPLGGQAALRLMTVEWKDTTIPDSFQYMVNNGYLGGYISAEMELQGRASAGVEFVAALMGSAATKSSPLDLWGNVKIPRIESYENIVSMDAEGWYSTPGGNVDMYSSLIGIPIAGVSQTAFIDYRTRIQSPYLGLKCGLNTTVVEGTSISGKALPGLYSNASSSGAMIFWNAVIPSETGNSTRNSNRNTTQLSSPSSRDMMAPETITPLRIKYVPLYESNITLDCNVSSTYVETEIWCSTSFNCTAVRVRHSKLNHFPPAWTLLDLSWRTLPLMMRGMLSNFNGKLRYPQLFDRYLSDPNLTHSNYANVSQTTEEEYTIRLGHMLNAYFSCLNGFFAITAGINNETAYFYDNNQTFTIESGDAQGALWADLYTSTVPDRFKTKVWPSNGTKVERKEIIVAHRRWVIILSIASILLMILSLASPFVHNLLATGMDVAMNISSLAVRDNPYVPLPHTGTFLDAADRAKLLRNLKVRFGDSESAGEIGSLAIGTYGSKQWSGIAKVRKGRLYE